ncbi:hypothetical protein AWV80_04075 [Cupriavidus sp. UYMU48A]|nr:hypothetical protein AWV80_04075 [Cupriavidus sp. UYMU48A]
MSISNGLKRWFAGNRRGLIAIFGVIALTLISLQFAEFFPGNKDGQTIAAWFQAVGSIATILGASHFALHQVNENRRLAEQLEADRLKRRWSSVKAVVDALYQQCLDVSVEFEGDDPDLRFMAFSLSYNADCFTRALRRVDAAPLFELDSDVLVTAITNFKEEAERLQFCANWGNKQMMVDGRPKPDFDVPNGFLKEMGKVHMKSITECYLAIQAVTGGTVLKNPKRFEPYC